MRRYGRRFRRSNRRVRRGRRRALRRTGFARRVARIAKSIVNRHVETKTIDVAFNGGS